MRETWDTTDGLRILCLTCVSRGLLVLCQNDPLLWSFSVIASLPLNRPIQETHSAVKTALSKCSFSSMKASHKPEPTEVFWWGICVGPTQLCFKGAISELMRLINNWPFFAKIPTSVRYLYISYLENSLWDKILNSHFNPLLGKSPEFIFRKWIYEKTPVGYARKCGMTIKIGCS